MLKQIKVIILFVAAIHLFPCAGYSCEGNLDVTILFKPEQVNFDKIKNLCSYPDGYLYEEGKLSYQSHSDRRIAVSISKEKEYYGNTYFSFSFGKTSRGGIDYKRIIMEELGILARNGLINISDSDINSISNLASAGKVIYNVYQGCEEIDFSPDPSSKQLFFNYKRSISKTDHWGWADSNVDVRINDNSCFAVEPTMGECGGSMVNGPIATLNL
jgi:hypothetical protein